jgi:hypothetical protein
VVVTTKTGQMKAEGKKNVRRTLGEQWIGYLTKLSGISETKAGSITRVYPTFRALMDAYRRCSSDKERRAMLQDLKIDGGRKLGPIMSARLAEMLWSLDPDTIV